jgi:predicted nucleotidyltransferase
MAGGGDKLRESALAALAWFGLFGQPLTLSEIRRYRYQSEVEDRGSELEDNDLLTALENSPARESGGFWFLDGSERSVETRLRRDRHSIRKFNLARGLASFLRLLPSVRLVAVCNSLAMTGAGPEDDIDIFIVCRPGTVWATRLISVGVLKALGLRPDGDSRADRFCMSFFLSEDRLDMSVLAAGDDPYLHYWLATLVPVYDAGGVMDALFCANAWVSRRLPGFRPRRSGGERSVPPAPRWTAALLPAVAALERPARSLQERMFPKRIREMANRDSRVVISDGVLKFHVNDRREKYGRLFREGLKSMRYETAN